MTRPRSLLLACALLPLGLVALGVGASAQDRATAERSPAAAPAAEPALDRGAAAPPAGAGPDLAARSVDHDLAAGVGGAELSPPPRDPFNLPRAGAAAAASEDALQASWALEALPPLRIKGMLKLAGRPAGAVLALGDSSRVVRAGDALTVFAGGREVRLLVTVVDDAGVALQVGPGGPLLRVR